MLLAWQTWLTQPGKFNLQLQSPSLNYDPNIRMRLDPKNMHVTFNGAKSQFMVFRGRDCQEVTICEIIINNIPLNNANKEVDLGIHLLVFLNVGI